jgi:RNA polymerase sigma-70 factor (ECF subfamily)
MDEKTYLFEGNRRLLEGLAYRMLGTLADARDVVQDTYLKWREVDMRQVRNARSWLVTVCSRLALNAINSARARRETYVGTWLPEPYVDEQTPSPADQSQIDDTISVALMLALEKLTPPERAAFLLHEVFGYSFDEISAILGKTSAACRKLASRARIAVKEAKPRFEASADEHLHLVEAFLQAARGGELEKLKMLLAKSVEFHSDGGGRVEAVPEILHGATTVAQFFARIWTQYLTGRVAIKTVPQWFNGVPGVLIYENGKLATALSVSVEAGVIRRIYALRNPEKLAVFDN